MIAQQLLLPFGLGTEELYLRLLRFDITQGGIDLGLGKIALRRQFSGVELHDDLAGLQRIAFAHEDFFYPTPHARCDMDLVDFDGSGDTVDGPLTT